MRNPSESLIALRRLFLAGGLAILFGCGDSSRGGEAEPLIPGTAIDLSFEDPLSLSPKEVEVLRLQAARDGRALVGLLTDSDPSIRSRVAFALASVQWEGARGALETALTDREPGVRANAAFALGQLPSVDGGARLIRALESEAGSPGADSGPSEVRIRIYEALGKAGGATALEALLEMDVVHEREREAHALGLARLGVRRWQGALGGAGEGQGSGAPGVEEAGPLDEALLAFLLSSITDPVPGVREAAAWGLGRLPDPSVWAPHAGRVRQALAEAALDDPVAIPLLTALGRLRDAADMPEFSRWLGESPDWRVRLTATRAIGLREWVGSEEVRGALVKAMEADPSAHVRSGAAQALVGLLPPPTSASMTRWVQGDPLEWRSQAPFLRLLLEEGRWREVLGWTQRVQQADPSGVMVGVEALSLTSGSEVTDFFFSLSAASDPRLQAAGARGLAARWEYESTEIFSRIAIRMQELLVDGSVPAAAIAARTVGHPAFHGFGSVALLEERFRAQSGAPEEAPLLEAILQALGETGDPAAIPLIEEARADNRPDIRRAAGSALELLTGIPSRGLNLPGVLNTVDVELLQTLGARPIWVLETEQGTLRIRLAPQQAPLTVQQVARLTEAGRYDGTPFHRVIGNFVTQGGDYAHGDGTGSAGFTLPSELTRIPFVRGVVGMASAGKDTEGSQFFMTHSPQPHLDGIYTAFGWIVEGAEVMDRLLEGHRILRATIEATVPEAVPSSEVRPQE